MFPLCDLQGYVDLISPARCFASRRLDLGLFLFVFVGKILFSMLRNPSHSATIFNHRPLQRKQTKRKIVGLIQLDTQATLIAFLSQVKYTRIVLVYITRLNGLLGSHSATILIIDRCNKNKPQEIYRPHIVGNTQATLLTLLSQVKYTRIVLVYITRLNGLSGSHSATISNYWSLQ
jgi:hypothetical protein